MPSLSLKPELGKVSVSPLLCPACEDGHHHLSPIYHILFKCDCKCQCTGTSKESHSGANNTNTRFSKDTSGLV